MEKKVKRQSKVPGIFYYSFTNYGHKYLHVIHEKSKLPIVRFDDKPVAYINKLIQKCDEVLAEGNWTGTAKKSATDKNYALTRTLRGCTTTNKDGFYSVK